MWWITFMQLSSQALDLIAMNYSEHIDSNPKYLKVNNNYKGRDEHGNMKVLPFAVPAADAFYVLTQMATTPNDVDDGSGDVADAAADAAAAAVAAESSPSAGKRKSTFGKLFARGNSTTASAASDESKDGKAAITSAAAPPSSSKSAAASAEVATTQIRSDAAVAEQRGSEEQRGSSNRRSNNNRFLSPSGSGGASAARKARDLQIDSIQEKLDTTVKVVVKHATQSQRLNVNDFSVVLNDLQTCQFDLNVMLLYPEPGFVVAARRIHKGQKIFLNICHDPLVGLVTLKEKDSKRFQGHDAKSLAATASAAMEEMWEQCMASEAYQTTRQSSSFGAGVFGSGGVPYIIGAINNSYIAPEDARSSSRANYTGTNC